MTSILKTVVTEKEKERQITSPYPHSFGDDSDTIKFTIQGLMPERTIEDRDVFINIETKQKNTPDKAQQNGVHAAFWIRGEKAIELGQALIEGGSFALQANMIQHQSNWCKTKLQSFINQNIVDHIEIKEISHKPVNYGSGFHTINIKPIWNPGKAPKYQEEFNFDMVMYYTGDKDFNKNIKSIIGDIKYIVIKQPTA